MEKEKKVYRGFTLVEMLVVILIVGLLAAISIPTFLGVEGKARIGACDSDLNAVRQALGFYEIEHQGYYVPAASSYANLVVSLVDTMGKQYMTLPPGTNWTNFVYTATSPTNTYVITCNALDHNRTLRTATPLGIR